MAKEINIVALAKSAMLTANPTLQALSPVTKY
jgi:hypothetical protein